VLVAALVAAGVGAATSTALTASAVSPGVLALGIGNQVVVMTTGGHVLRRLDAEVVDSLSFSPDGKTLAFTGADSAGIDVETVSMHGGHERVIQDAADPAWSANGGGLVFSRQASNGNASSLYVIGHNGPARPLETSGFFDDNPSESSNGSEVVFSRLVLDHSGNPGPSSGLYVTNGSTTRVLLDGPTWSSATDPAWSPNGKQIAFVSDLHPLSADPTSVVYVVDADGKDPHRLTPPTGSDDESDPRWSPDGSKLSMVVSSPMEVRSGVAVVPSSGGAACLVYATWGGISGADWQPGSGNGVPSRCVGLLPPRPTPILGCTPAAERNAVDRSGLPLVLKWAANRQFFPMLASCATAGPDHLQVLFVEFPSGGSSGLTAWAAFVPTRTQWQMAASQSGDCMSLDHAGDVVNVTSAYLVPGGSGPCGGGVAHESYRWRGTRLVLERNWRQDLLRQ
jgi:Tol biopolymer transport system component